MGKWVEAIQVLELTGSTMAMKRDDNDWYCQMEPSSVTVRKHTDSKLSLLVDG